MRIKTGKFISEVNLNHLDSKDRLVALINNSLFDLVNVVTELTMQVEELKDELKMQLDQIKKAID